MLYQIVISLSFCSLWYAFVLRIDWKNEAKKSSNVVLASGESHNLLKKEVGQNNPRTEIRTLTNVKMPLKAHGNNVTLESMYCQKCRVYGLCRLSVSVSAGEGDTLTKYDNIPQIQHNSQDLSLCKPVIFSQQTKYYIFILKIKLGHNRTIFHLNY